MKFFLGTLLQLVIGSLSLYILTIGLFPKVVTNTLIPTDDVYVRAGSHSDLNYSSDSRIVLKNSGATSGNTREGILKFDVSGLSGTVTRATLRMYLYDCRGDIDVSAYSAPNSWNGATVTWNTKPATGSLRDTISLTDSDDGIWTEFDVTDFIESEVSNNAEDATIVLSSNSSLFAYFHTKENVNSPELVVEVYDVGTSSSSSSNSSSSSTSSSSSSSSSGGAAPNFVLCMSDDQGWGDVGYNGHPYLVTPTLDTMAAEGLRFDRFYTARAVCSPARAAFVTGRNPMRMGTYSANWAMRPEELTIAEVMSDRGYSTAHFGKWHLGPVKAESPLSPNNQGFGYSLSADNYFDENPELSENGQLPQQYSGASSIVLAENATDYIQTQVQNNQPFFVIVWFAAPHSPQEPTYEDFAHYEDLDGEPGIVIDDQKQQRYYGEITELDRAMGIIRDSLRDLGVADNTMLFFTADNGPSNGLDEDVFATGGLRGNKGDTYEGGIREPAVMEWPARISDPRRTSVPASTLDLFPTILSVVGLSPPANLPMDGIDILDLIDGIMTERPKPLAFWRAPNGSDQEDNGIWDSLTADDLVGYDRTFRNYNHPEVVGDLSGVSALIDGDWKVYRKGDDNDDLELYYLADDPGESNNLVDEEPDRAMEMMNRLEAWMLDVEQSQTGEDYPIGPVIVN